MTPADGDVAADKSSLAVQDVTAVFRSDVNVAERACPYCGGDGKLCHRVCVFCSGKGHIAW